MKYMWTREQLKTRAKSALRGSYWKAFLVSIILSIVGSDREGINLNWNTNNNNVNINTDYNPQMVIEGARHMTSYAIPIITITIIVVLLILCFRIFIGYAIEVGGKRYFLRAAEKDVELNNLGYSFKNSRYMGIIKSMLYKN